MGSHQKPPTNHASVRPPVSEWCRIKTQNERLWFKGTGNHRHDVKYYFFKCHNEKLHVILCSYECLCVCVWICESSLTRTHVETFPQFPVVEDAIKNPFTFHLFHSLCLYEQVLRYTELWSCCSHKFNYKLKESGVENLWHIQWTSASIHFEKSSSQGEKV